MLPCNCMDGSYTQQVEPVRFTGAERLNDSEHVECGEHVNDASAAGEASDCLRVVEGSEARA